MASRSNLSLHVAVVAAALLVLSACSPSAPDLAELGPAAITGGRLWPTAGHDLSNTRHAKTERRIGPDTVADLAPRWITATDGDVTATPAVDGASVYVPDGAGKLYRLDRATGAILWSATIESYTGAPGDVSGTTPAIHDGLLILGNQGGPGQAAGQAGARVFAVDKETGAPFWVSQVDDHPTAIITQSPVVFDGTVFVGVSSVEDLVAVEPTYPCCTFRARMVALDVATGQVLWSTWMAPEGYAGNAISGGTPVVDPKRRLVYVTTGPNTRVPDDVRACVAAAGDDREAIRACSAPDDLFDSIVALDLDTGAVRWATRTEPYDAWTFACLGVFDPTNCPDPSGPGLGFAQGAMLFRVGERGRPVELLGAGHKSGTFWVLDPDTGQIQWLTFGGPGGPASGLLGSSAVDGARIYVVNANAFAEPYVFPDGSTTTRGVWSALDAATGATLWQTEDPSGDPAGPAPHGTLQGPVTVANGVVFGCSAGASGGKYALEAATGTVLWSFAGGGSCAAGAAVVDGTVFWGSGSAPLFGLPGATGSNHLYAFGLND